MERSEMEQKIKEEEDFIHAPKFGNSLNKFLVKTEVPLENGVIARLLMISEEQVEELYEESVEKLRAGMVEEDEV